MKLITAAIQKKLEANCIKTSETGESGDVVLKLFGGNGTWLITEIEPDNDTMWGLCDIGMGCCEFGTVSLNELKSVRLPYGMSVERDLHFSGGTVQSFRDYYNNHQTLGGC
jgi:hypothetical protein